MTTLPSRAVVFGGGGLTGVAWLTGLLATFQDAELNLRDADLVLGTSAGSIAGAQLAAGRDFRRLYRFLAADRVPARSALLGLYGRMPTPDQATIAAFAEKWHSETPSSVETRRLAGQAALGAKTMPERAFVGLLTAFLHMRHWPGPALAIATVDAHQGELRVLRQADGVPVGRAAAASAAVPQVFPAVTIQGRPYIDGGTASVTNADCAAGYDVVLLFVDAEMAPGAGPLSRAAIELEVARLEAAGSQVVLIEPDAASLAAIGGMVALNPEHIQPAARAGRLQGRAELARVAAAWNAPAS